MNAENTQTLFQMFPRLYRGHAKARTESPMGRGFECEDGWFGLIRDLSAAIERACDEAGVPVPEAVQVKEKLGGLRFYLDRRDVPIAKAIRRAEEASYKICEECGREGTLSVTSRGWYRTVCAEHAREHGMEPVPEQHWTRIGGHEVGATLVDQYGRRIASRSKTNESGH